ncbi:hypothetical protein [Sphingomonas sp. 3-13AW]|uniref:hypothetical protein n=1 Tax=Sphingomonas sp. 3-13AW TaxID=3050450 RepID=UPI003BB6349D
MRALESCSPSSEAGDRPVYSEAGKSAATPALGLRAGWIYPLKDPDEYWDEDDADKYDIEPDKRFAYARVPSEADPGDCYIHDVWIVDDEGCPHPGYEATPTPIRTEDLDLERGRLLPGATPKPMSIFDAGWFTR